MTITNNATRRRSKRFKKLSGKLYAERVRIDRQGYDKSGRYWGIGQKLYRVSTDDGVLDGYVRAPSATEAKSKEYDRVFGWTERLEAGRK